MGRERERDRNTERNRGYYRKIKLRELENIT